MIIATLVWWYLFTGVGTTVSPIAAGPYPTQEACRLAGRSQFPTDERFMTTEEIVSRRATLRIEQARWEVEHQRLIEKELVKGTRSRTAALSDGTQIQISKDGKVVEAGSGMVVWGGGTWQTNGYPVTGCLH